MSKKRNKNQRKKQTRGRGAAGRDQRGAGSSEASQSAKLNARLERDYEDPAALNPIGSGPGAIGRMRDMMTHGEEGESASLLHKRRSCGELLLWLVGGAAVCWVITKLVVAAIDVGAMPSK
jgi:hypothetical protein